MTDRVFEVPRLVSIYDALDADRADLDVYAAVLDGFGARRVLDIGCGTGTFALVLAERGLEVAGVDPAAGSLDVARARPGAERVRWLLGTASALPPMQVDAATMTANVAQAIVDPADWHGTLQGAWSALRPGGRLIFESRDPTRRAWEHWTRAESFRTTVVAGVGAVQKWEDLLAVSGPLVTFRTTFVFESDGAC